MKLPPAISAPTIVAPFKAMRPAMQTPNIDMAKPSH